MALIKCPECGREISDAAASCPHCGFAAEKTDDSTKESGTKKNRAIRFIAVFALIIAGVIAVEVVSNGKAKKEAYKQDMSAAVNEMLAGAIIAEEVCGKIHDVWYDTIYEKRNPETKQYIHNDDFNDSLNTLFQSNYYTKAMEFIDNHRWNVKEVMERLAYPPKGMEEAYQSVKTLYEAYLDLTNMATNPKGNLKTYTENSNNASSRFVSQYEAALIYTQ